MCSTREKDSHAPTQACAAAVKLIEQDDTIFIDCGATTTHLAALIPDG